MSGWPTGTDTVRPACRLRSEKLTCEYFRTPGQCRPGPPEPCWPEFRNCSGTRASRRFASGCGLPRKMKRPAPPPVAPPQMLPAAPAAGERHPVGCPVESALGRASGISRSCPGTAPTALAMVLPEFRGRGDAESGHHGLTGRARPAVGGASRNGEMGSGAAGPEPRRGTGRTDACRPGANPSPGTSTVVQLKSC